MMKATLFALFVGLLMVGCGESLPSEELQMNGKHTEYYDDGQKKAEKNYKDGKPDGLLITYNEDGTEDYRFTYKDGEQVYD